MFFYFIQTKHTLIIILGNQIYSLELSTVMMYMYICLNISIYHMPQYQYLASYMYIITVYNSLYYILKHKISNLSTYTCVMASKDHSSFYLFKRQNFITINLQPASTPPHPLTSSLLRLPQIRLRFKRQHRLIINPSIKPIFPFYSVSLKDTDNQSNTIQR